MNINQLMKQAQAMQKKMQEFKDKMSDAEYTGKSGGGLVVIAINGESTLKSISIDPSLLQPSEKEMLEDLIVAAFNDAKSKLEADSQNQLSSMGGMGLPPGLKMPF